MQFGNTNAASPSTTLRALKGRRSARDTFSTVFRTLDPAAFAEIFARFAAGFGTAINKDDVVTVNGKAMKRADEKSKQSAPRYDGYAGQRRRSNPRTGG